jgi:hypothetical protein
VAVQEKFCMYEPKLMRVVGNCISVNNWKLLDVFLTQHYFSIPKGILRNRNTDTVNLSQYEMVGLCEDCEENSRVP